MRLSTDATEEAWTGVLDKVDGIRQVVRSMFSVRACGPNSTKVVFGTSDSSSTQREFLGLLEAPRSFTDFLPQKTVVVYGNNQFAIRILDIGSKRADLQGIAALIFELVMGSSITIVPRLLHRCHLQEEDDDLKFC